MAGERKVSEAKQKILDNYETQRRKFREEGYQEHSEMISMVKANVMVLVTSLPLVILALVIWILAGRGPVWLAGRDYLVTFLVFLVTALSLIHISIRSPASVSRM